MPSSRTSILPASGRHYHGGARLGGNILTLQVDNDFRINAAMDSTVTTLNDGLVLECDKSDTLGNDRINAPVKLMATAHRHGIACRPLKARRTAVRAGRVVHGSTNGFFPAVVVAEPVIASTPLLWL
jgi:hypothetical protein